MMIAADRIPVAATSITKSEVAANEALSGARTRLSLWPSEPILLLPRIPPPSVARSATDRSDGGGPSAPPTRRRGFWRLGAGATMLPGLQIGADSIVGAGSGVIHEPANLRRRRAYSSVRPERMRVARAGAICVTCGKGVVTSHARWDMMRLSGRLMSSHTSLKPRGWFHVYFLCLRHISESLTTNSSVPQLRIASAVLLRRFAHS